MNANGLRDYSWSYETINNRISRFYRPISSQTIPLVVHCDSDDSAIWVKNRLHDLAEADIQAKIPGKIYVGDYYTNGYVTGSEKSNYLISNRLCNIKLKFTSDDPSWYREQKHVFLPDSGSGMSIGDGVDHPFDYPYDYGISMNGRMITCDTAGDNAFKLLIYGEATNPVVIINGHTYAVNGTVGKGETLLIDSLNRTITLTTATGGKVNWFDKRSRDEYIFEPISAGQNAVSWLGTFGFDLTVIEKRSEPRWT